MTVQHKLVTGYDQGFDAGYSLAFDRGVAWARQDQEGKTKFDGLYSCVNCHYTKDNSDWYVNTKTNKFYCTIDCLIAKEGTISE